MRLAFLAGVLGSSGVGTAYYDDTQYANPYVNALVDGDRWTDGDTVTYYLDGNWQQYGASASIQAAAAAWSAVSNVKYQLTTDRSAADYRETLYSYPKGNGDGSITLGSHYLPGSGQQTGQYNTATNYWNAADIAKGGLMYETFLHELGHGLGLDHPFDGDQVFPGVTPGESTSTGDNDLNSQLYTVMTYNDVSAASGDSHTAAYGQAETPMAFDVAAVQALYGANMSTATGNDTYTLPKANDAGTGYTCIWDAGGTDTISAAGISQSCQINLQAATLDDETGGGGFLSSVSGIFGGFTIAHGVTIEDAVGGSGNDTIIANDAGDRLDGGTGDDTIILGAGHDTVVLQDGEYVAVNNFTEGVDSFDISRVDYASVKGTGNYGSIAVTFYGADGNPNSDVYFVPSLETQITGAVFQSLPITWEVEATNFTGSAGNDVLTGSNDGAHLNGGAGNDRLTGGAGDDVFDGGAGNDTMYGGAGNDTYVVDTARDLVYEDANSGYDTILSSVTYTLGKNAEALTLTGHSATSATGNELANVLTGNEAANVLDGGAGDDTMYGGAGDDTYVVDSAKDLVYEDVNKGYDTILSSVSYTLGKNAEALTLTGHDATSATGNELANALTGNDAANTLIGNAGDDRLDGGAGADTMYGGAGNDTYVVDNARDLVYEDANSGYDTILSSVSYTLGKNAEALTLTGHDATNASGNTLANVLTGNDAANVLDGGTGDDTMYGGAGDDTYIVDSARDLVFEDANSGYDTILSSVSYTLGKNAEALTLSGHDATTATGNELANVLIGNDAANTLIGNGGNDVLDGGLGHDILQGGAGDDTYIVDSVHDQVIEAANAGTDTVRSAVSWTLGDNLENLVLAGSSASAGTGNTLANTITGNDRGDTLSGLGGDDHLVGGKGADVLLGGDGNDILAGGGGRDVMTGGAGNDHFVFATTGDFASAKGGSTDEITDFRSGDKIDISAIDAVPGGANDAFRWIGTAVFDGHGGELRMYEQSGATYLQADLNGDKVTDFALKLDGLHALTAADFVL